MNDVSQRIAPAAIRKTIDVKAPVDRAFAVFADRIGGDVRGRIGRQPWNGKGVSEIGRDLARFERLEMEFLCA